MSEALRSIAAAPQVTTDEPINEHRTDWVYHAPPSEYTVSPPLVRAGRQPAGRLVQLDCSVYADPAADRLRRGARRAPGRRATSGHTGRTVGRNAGGPAAAQAADDTCRSRAGDP